MAGHQPKIPLTISETSPRRKMDEGAETFPWGDGPRRDEHGAKMRGTWAGTTATSNVKQPRFNYHDHPTLPIAEPPAAGGTTRTSISACTPRVALLMNRPFLI